MKNNWIRDWCSSISLQRKAPPWNHKTTHSLMLRTHQPVAALKQHVDEGEDGQLSALQPSAHTWPPPHQTRHLCLPKWINCFLFWPGNLVWLVSKAPRYKLLRNFSVFGKILNCYLKPTKRKHKSSKNRSAHHRSTYVGNTRAETRSSRQIGIFKRDI